MGIICKLRNGGGTERRQITKGKKKVRKTTKIFITEIRGENEKKKKNEKKKREKKLCWC